LKGTRGFQHQESINPVVPSVDLSDLAREEAFLYKNVPFNPKTMGDWCVERSNPNL
jgi:hypothetical protein